jgi:hypothetical protein
MMRHPIPAGALPSHENPLPWSRMVRHNPSTTIIFSRPVGKPLVDNLGDGIWEVRSRLDNRIARTLFAMVEQEIVLLHGFIKKQQKTPQDELELAKKRKRQYLQNLWAKKIIVGATSGIS